MARLGALFESAKLLAVLAIGLQVWATRSAGMDINGTRMSMDEAIMAASTSSRIFGLMEDADVVRVEMDMLFKTEVWESMMTMRQNSSRHRRKAIRDSRFRWPNAVVPYRISASWSQRDNQLFQEAIEDYHRFTCIRFRQATSADRNYLQVVDGSGCSSYVGQQGGGQSVSLASGCRHKGIIIHELGHAIGFQHEQTRYDRDNHVRILKENIYPSMEFNFMKYSPSEMDAYGVPYDYLSVMHYGEYAFSHNGQRTIITTDPKYQGKIGNRGGFSFRDIKLANVIYSCAAKNKCAEQRCPGEGFVGPDCLCWCPSGDDVRPVTSCEGQATTSLRPTPTSACSDNSSNCVGWARQGHCTSAQYGVYMSIHCRATCNLCQTGQATTSLRPTPTSACSDGSSNCVGWARQGHCTSAQYGEYMSIHCRATCNLCQTVTRSAVATTSPRTQVRTTASPTTASTSARRAATSTLRPSAMPCLDANQMCNAWADRGECDANPSYMLTYCAASCRSCHSPSATAGCTDVGAHCPYWRGLGHCSSLLYSAYMQLNCPRTCGACGEITVTPRPTIGRSAASTSPTNQLTVVKKQVSRVVIRLSGAESRQLASSGSAASGQSESKRKQQKEATISHHQPKHRSHKHAHGNRKQ